MYICGSRNYADTIIDREAQGIMNTYGDKSQYRFVDWVSKFGTALCTEYNNFLHNELSVYPGCIKSPYTDIQNPEPDMCHNTNLVFNRYL